MEFIEKGVPEIGPAFLEPTEFFDFDREPVRAFAYEAAAGATTAKDKAVRLYYAVRDGIRYDPYRIRLERDLFKASSVLAAKAGFCLPKANLLVACCRAVGIAAGIGLSDVMNHLCTERLAHIMGGRDLFLHHGYAVIHIDGHWVKAAPAFNIELCEKFDVLPTEFDGESHALFQELDARGRRHMEYVADHGIWSDFPFDRVAADFSEYYPESFYVDAERARANEEFDARKHATARAFEDEKPVA